LNPIRFSKILIVDDSKAFRVKIKQILREAKIGYVYYEAETGKEGISKYITLKPHLTLLDISMPDIDGISVSKAIMKHDPKAKIVIISTKDNQGILNATVNKGWANDYVVKPFDPRLVVIAVSKQLTVNRHLRVNQM